MSSNATESGQSTGDDGWMTVERKKEPKILARKGKRGISWRIPNDNKNGRRRRSNSGTIKKEKKRQDFPAKDTTPVPPKTAEKVPADVEPKTSKTKAGESSWVAAARRGAKKNKRSRFSGAKLTNFGGKSSVVKSRQAKHSSVVGSEDDGNGNSGQILRGKLKLRKQLQQILFTNVNQAVDELYYICEFDSEIESATAALELMTGWRIIFKHCWTPCDYRRSSSL